MHIRGDLTAFLFILNNLMIIVLVKKGSRKPPEVSQERRQLVGATYQWVEIVKIANRQFQTDHPLSLL